VLETAHPESYCPLRSPTCCYYCEHRDECDKVCDYVTSYLRGEGNEEGMASEDE